MTVLSSVLSFFFPPECLGCGREDFLICPECCRKIPAKPQQKSFKLPYFEEILVFTDYENPLIKSAIKKLKFRYARGILNDLEPFFRKNFPRTKIPEPTSFIPVPLHFLRQNERGFNQSDLLARLFSEIHNGSGQICHLLKRTRNTPHQSHLSKEERQINVREAFQVRKKIAGKIPLGSSLILVDDVVTTGSTFIECAKALQEYGYEKIRGMTVARG